MAWPTVYGEVHSIKVSWIWIMCMLRIHLCRFNKITPICHTSLIRIASIPSDNLLTLLVKILNRYTDLTVNLSTFVLALLRSFPVATLIYLISDEVKRGKQTDIIYLWEFKPVRIVFFLNLSSLVDWNATVKVCETARWHFVDVYWSGGWVCIYRWKNGFKVNIWNKKPSFSAKWKNTRYS